MKRFLAIILAGLMLLSLAACGGKDEGVLKSGTLELGSTGGYIEHLNETILASLNQKIEHTNYNNLSTALLDLESGKIDFLSCGQTTADYVIAHNDKFEAAPKNATSNYSMMTMDSNTEVYNILNNAIKAMKEDGTLDKLIENELKAYIANEPVAKDLPKFEGARIIKVGITGDIPPMDFVASNGKAAGFNIALLTEIANRAQVNFELVQIESSARPISLSSGKVDVVFWAKNVTCGCCSQTFKEEVANTVLTESYYSDVNVQLRLKSAK